MKYHSVIAAAVVAAISLSPAVAQAQTLFGSTAQACQPNCVGIDGAIARQEHKFGHTLGIVRLYYRGMPPSWSQLPDRGLCLSFRLPPAEVIAGKYDKALRAWFAAAPNRPVYWTYMHEPDHDINNGLYGIDAYRKAFDHILRLGGRNAGLHPTEILMGFTLRGASRHPWKWYLINGVEVLGFEAYSRTTDHYTSPTSLLKPAWEAAHSIGKVWATPELAAALVKGDNGSGRAAWLHNAASLARQHGSAFMSYFDNTNGTAAGAGTFHLTDSPSINAWGQELSR